MYIAFLTTEYPPLPSGGIGTSIRNLAHALVKLGHRVTVIGWGPTTEFEDEGVMVKFLGHTSVPKMGWLLNRKKAEKELNRLVVEKGLDIVEAHDWCGPSAGMKLRCPLVIRCNGTDTYFAHILAGRVRLATRLAECAALKTADGIAAVSHYTGTTTTNLFRLKKKVSVIPNSIDVDQFTPADFTHVEPNTLLYVGTVVRKKGILDLCDVFSAISELLPGILLRVVGRDAADVVTGCPSTWDLCHQRLSACARQHTEYVGAVPYQRVQEYIRRATICVFPSYAEACPLSWLEAMACAKPLVAYDIGWAAEVVKHGENGILTPLGAVQSMTDAIFCLMSHPELRHKFGLAARINVEKYFNSTCIAQQSINWYSEIMDRQSG